MSDREQDRARDFGELRGLMNRSVWTTQHRELFWSMVTRESAEHPDVFFSMWQPYIHDFTHHLIEPLAHVRSLEELAHAHRLVPEANFGLDLRGQKLDFDAVQKLVSSPLMSCVHTLCLRHTKMGWRELDAIARSGTLAHLHALDVSVNTLGVLAIAELEKAQFMNLRRLNIARSHIGHDGFHDLRKSSLLSRLTFLDVSHNRLGPRLARQFFESANMSNLEHLVWHDIRLDLDAWITLTRSPHLATLREFDADFHITRTSRPRLRREIEQSKTLHPDLREHLLTLVQQ